MIESPRGIAFVGDRLVLSERDGAIALPQVNELEDVFGVDRIEAARIPVPVGGVGGVACSAFALDGAVEVPRPLRLDGLRVAYHGLSEAEFRAAGTARQKVEWHRTHQFCSKCGSPTALAESHEAMACLECHQLHFPRIAPAVIVLVQRGDQALLGRSPRFADGVYSTLAGFVEAGESLEECLHREIEEEVGVRVTNVRYFGSQPHPFPHSLMVGFVADWLEGDIRIDAAEIEDARWFRRESLPELPHGMSIARALIDDFVSRTDPAR